MAAPAAGGAGAGGGGGGEPRESIRVVCRFRPLNKIELGKGSKCSVSGMTEEAVNVATADGNTYNFSFDRVYGTSSTQAEVYEYAAKPILDALFRGFNGCLLA
jgi:kinesin family member 5